MRSHGFALRQGELFGVLSKVVFLDHGRAFAIMVAALFFVQIS